MKALEMATRLTVLVLTAIDMVVLGGCNSGRESPGSIEAIVDGRLETVNVCRMRDGGLLLVSLGGNVVEVDTRAEPPVRDAKEYITTSGTFYMQRDATVSGHRIATGSLRSTHRDVITPGVFLLNDGVGQSVTIEQILATQQTPLLIRSSNNGMLVVDVAGDSGGGTVVHRVVTNGTSVEVRRIESVSLWAESARVTPEGMLLLGSTEMNGELVGWAMRLNESDDLSPVACIDAN